MSNNKPGRRLPGTGSPGPNRGPAPPGQNQAQHMPPDPPAGRPSAGGWMEEAPSWPLDAGLRGPPGHGNRMGPPNRFHGPPMHHQPSYPSPNMGWSPNMMPPPPHSRALGGRGPQNFNNMGSPPRQADRNYRDLGNNPSQPPPPQSLTAALSTYYIALVDSQTTENMSGHKMLIFRQGDHLLAKQTNGGWYWGCVQGRETEVEHGYFSPNQVRLASNSGASVNDAKMGAKKAKVEDEMKGATSKEVPKRGNGPSAKPQPKCSDKSPAGKEAVTSRSQKTSPKVSSPKKSRSIVQPRPSPTKCSIGTATRGYGGRSDWTVTIDCPAALDSIAVSLTLGFTKGKENTRVQIERKHRCTIWKAEPLNGYKATGCVVKIASDARDLVIRAAGHVADLLEVEARKVSQTKPSPGDKRRRETTGRGSGNAEPDQKRSKTSGAGDKEKSSPKPSHPNWSPPPADQPSPSNAKIKSPASNCTNKKKKEGVSKKKSPQKAPNTPSSPARAQPAPSKASSNSADTEKARNILARPSVPSTVTASPATSNDADVAAGSKSNVTSLSPAQPPFNIAVSGEVANQAKFPLGCPVVHESKDGVVVSGFVRSVFLVLVLPIMQSGTSKYVVRYDLATEGNFISNGSEKKSPIPEESLQFASKCPVLIPASFAPQLVPSVVPENDLIEGTVVSSYKGIGSVDESYIIALPDGGGRASGIPRDSVKFRPPSWRPSATRSPSKVPVLASDNTSKVSVPPVAVVSATDDASKISEVSSPPSTISRSNSESTKLLTIPDSISFSKVKTHLRGENESTSKKLGEKFGIEICVFGGNLPPPKSVAGSLLLPPLSDGEHPPSIYLKGSSRRVEQALKVIVHILLEKTYDGSDKEDIRRQLLEGAEAPIANDSRPIDASHQGLNSDGSNNDAGGIKDGSEEEPNSDDEPVGIFGGFGVADESELPNKSNDLSSSLPNTFEEMSKAVSDIVLDHGPMRVGNINVEFKKKFGQNIDYARFDCDKLTDLIRKVPLVAVKAENCTSHVEYTVYSKEKEAKDNLVAVMKDTDGLTDANVVKGLYKKKFGAELNHKALGYPKFKELIDSIPQLQIELSGKKRTTMKIRYREKKSI